MAEDHLHLLHLRPRSVPRFSFESAVCHPAHFWQHPHQQARAAYLWHLEAMVCCMMGMSFSADEIWPDSDDAFEFCNWLYNNPLRVLKSKKLVFSVRKRVVDDKLPPCRLYTRGSPQDMWF